MGFLTTHVLDTARGCPGSGIAISLFAIRDDGQRELVAQTVTNSDGRTDEPMLSGETFTCGIWELEFAVADYFRSTGQPVAEPAFLDRVPLRFGIADADAHYHVPLLVSPWSYSTYRGS
jgi:5-hydroxyisourate hydrolase